MPVSHLASPAPRLPRPRRRQQLERAPRRLGVPLLALFAAGVLPSAAAAQATLLTPYGPALQFSNDDDGWAAVDTSAAFPSGLRIQDEVYTDVYVGTNGYITFGTSYTGYSPLGVAGYTRSPIVAAQFDDIDLWKGGAVHAHVNTQRAIFTWLNVAPYSSPHHGSGTNTFQIVLRPSGGAGAQDFSVEIRYVALNWMTSGNLGPTPYPSAGYSAGDAQNYAEPPESMTSSFLSLAEGDGTLMWEIVDGVLLAAPTVHVTRSPDEITTESARAGGTVTSRNGFDLSERGVVYGTLVEPTLDDLVVVDEEYDYEAGDGVGEFTVSLEGLTQNTSYFVRAYATNQMGTSYGPQRQFRTKRPQTLTFADPGPRTYGDAPLLADATLDNSNTVALTSSDPSVAQVSGLTVTLVGAGTTTLRAAHAGNNTYAPAAVEHTLHVSTRGVVGHFSVEPTRVADGGVEVDVLSRALEGVLATDEADVALSGGVATLTDALPGADKVVTLAGASLSGARAAHYHLASVSPAMTTVVPAPVATLTIEASGGGPLVAVEPDVPFGIRVTAFDAFGNVATVVDRPVTIGSSGVMSLGEGASPPLVAGALELDVALSSWGTQTLTAALEPELIEVTSAPFRVAPAYGHLSVSFEIDDPRIVYGELFTFVVRVTNDGQHTADDPVVLNPLESEPRLVVEELAPSVGHMDTASGNWLPGPLAPGESATLTIHARGVQP